MNFEITLISRNDGPSRIEYRESSSRLQNPVSQVTELRDGLVLGLTRSTPASPSELQFKINNAPIILGFILAGENNCTYHKGAFKQQRSLYTPGDNGLSYLPDTAGRMMAAGNGTLCRLSIFISPNFLEDYLRLETRVLPLRLASVLKGQSGPFKWAGSRSGYKMSLVSQIMSCEYEGMVRGLFLESKALELAAIQLNECLEGLLATPGLAPRISRSDIKRLEEAREILVGNLSSPPGLAELARQVGITEKKLKYGFRQIFGSSVYDYFRNYRLDLAKHLINSSDLSVTEVAYEIGYQNLSHFSKAFESRFGIKPKRYQLRSRARSKT